MNINLTRYILNSVMIERSPERTTVRRKVKPKEHDDVEGLTNGMRVALNSIGFPWGFRAGCRFLCCTIALSRQRKLEILWLPPTAAEAVPVPPNAGDELQAKAARALLFLLQDE